MDVKEREDVTALVDVLRSGKDIPAAAAAALANLLDSGVPGNVKLVARRRSGKKTRDILHEYEIWMFLGHAFLENNNKKDAICQALQKYNIGDSKSYYFLKL